MRCTGGFAQSPLDEMRGTFGFQAKQFCNLTIGYLQLFHFSTMALASSRVSSGRNSAFFIFSKARLSASCKFCASTVTFRSCVAVRKIVTAYFLATIGFGLGEK